jgi:carboxymethylenebutenolidase
MEDASFDDAAKERLERALDAGGVDYEIEDYAARHGWVPRDSPAHDEAAAQRHWDTLLPLLKETLS